MKKFSLIIMLAVITITSLKAQLSINAEFRPRGEFRHGYKSMFTEDDNAAYFISQRTRLGIAYTNEKYSLRITGQDVRIWGDESLYSSTSVKGDNASVDLYEAWFQLNIGANSHLKIGRQEWVYDDQRLLAKRNWAQTGMTYDGLLLNFDNKDFRFDLGLSLNNDAENTIGNEYTPDKMKFLDFIYWSKNLGESSKITFKGILSGYQKEEGSETIYAMGTYGPYFQMNNSKFKLDAYFYHQTGTNKTSQKVNAYLLSIKAMYKLSNIINIGPGLDLISGNDPAGNSKTDHSFDLLYGGRHRFMGDMDYFSSLSKSVSDAGLVDVFAKANFSFNKKNSLNIAYHHFATQNSIPNPLKISKDFKKSLGDEIDLMYRYIAEVPAELCVGFALFNTTETMEYLQGISENAAAFQYFMWIQLSFTPEIFTTRIH